MTDRTATSHPAAFMAVFAAAWVTRLLIVPVSDPPKTELLAFLAVGTAGRLLGWVVLPLAWLVVIERRPVASAVHPVERRSVRLAAGLVVLLAAVLLLGMRLTRGH